MTEAQAIIARLGLSPHPEGGWFRETWRASEPAERGSATAIYFLLEEGQRSHWHRVDATEIWLWHAGDPIRLLRAAADNGPVETIDLGPDILSGQQPQALIAPGAWQAAQADRGWALVSCIVSPAFRFEGFELAPEGWSPGQTG